MKKEKKEIMKKIGSIVVAGTILLGSNSIVLAKENNYVSANNIKQSTTNKQEEIEVYYNGERIEFDQQPILVNDRTLVPFRKVFESMGCIVYYNNSESKVMALTKEGDILTHTIGTNTFDLNGEEKTFDSASTILNDRTLIPLRAVAETLSAEVEWNDKEQTVTIEKEETKLDDIEKEVINHVLDINYNPKDTKRYVEYRRQHPELSIEQVIMDVNMDLDKELVLVTVNNKVGDITYNGMSYKVPKEEDIEIIENPEDVLAYSNKFNHYPESYEPTDLENANQEYVEKARVTGSWCPNAYLRKEANLAYQEMCDAYLNEDSTRNSNSLEVFYGYNNVSNLQTNINSMKQIGIQRFDISQAGDFAYTMFEQPNASKLRSGLAFYITQTPNYTKTVLEYKQKYYELNDREIYELDNWSRDANAKQTMEWINSNCYRFGFCQPYKEENQYITHMEPQPYFLVYIGKEEAQKMHDENLNYDTFHAKYINPVVNENKFSIEKESTEKVLKKF